MAVSETPVGAYEAEVGGIVRPLLLRNEEIERFERQYAPLGMFEVFDQLFGRGTPQVRHVRDIIALALIGGGSMTDRQADEVIASLPPSENPTLRLLAQTVVGLAFMPLLDDQPKKKAAGSGKKKAQRASSTTGRKAASRTSRA